MAKKKKEIYRDINKEVEETVLEEARKLMKKEPEIKLRDSKGRFTTRTKVVAKYVLYLWVIVAFLGMMAYVTEKYVDWRKSTDIVYTFPIEVNFHKPIRFEEAKPVEVLSPLAKEVIEEPVKTENLTDEELILLEAFGERNFAVARALAVCESGMNEEAINWQSKDIGLMQINLPIWEDEIKDKFGYSRSDLLRADKNVEVAKWIWDRADGQEGDNKGSFSPWVALTTNCFEGNL